MADEKTPPTLESLQATIDSLEYDVSELQTKVDDLEDKVKELEDLKASIPEDPKADLDDIFGRLNELESRL